MKTKENLIIFSGIFVMIFAIGFIAYSSGKRSQLSKQTKIELKLSEKVVKNYKKKYDSIQVKYLKLEKQKQTVKIVYLKGKEDVKYITHERIRAYKDTLCKKDVIVLKDQLSLSDSLISIQERQLIDVLNQKELAQQIIEEKDNQINLYKNNKPKIKPFGIGIIGGAGSDFENGLKPFVGLGVSYNLIRF